MARLEGPFQFSGRLGNVIGRRQKDGTIILAQAPVKSGKTTEKQLEVQQEFTLSVMARQRIRKDMGLVAATHKESTFTQRLTSKLREMIAIGERIEGHRSLSMQATASLLEGLQIRGNSNFLRDCTGPDTLTHQPNAGIVIWNPVVPLHAMPKSEATAATHFSLGLTLMPLRSYAWDQMEQRHTPQESMEFNTTEFQSEVFSLEMPPPKFPVWQLDAPTPWTPEMPFVAITSITLYQKMNEDYFPIETGKAAEFTKVFF